MKIRKKIKLFLQEIILDKKTTIILLQKLTQAVLGILFIFLIINFFEIKDQALYYSMSSILSAYVLFDLGFFSFLVQKSSMYVGLKNKNLYWSFFLWNIKFYFLVFLLILLLIPIGFLFFGYEFYQSYFYEWIFVVFIIGIGFAFQAFTNIIEAKQFIFSYKMRIYSNFFAAISSITFFLNGLGFLSLASLSLGYILTGIFYLNKNVKKIISSHSTKINWKQNILKYQKNVALYFIGFYLFINLPVILSHNLFSKENVAGIGLTIVIANVLIYLATSPIISIIPSFTKKINLKKIQSGKIIFFNKLKISFVLTFLITIAYLLLIIFIKDFSFSNRFLNLNNSLLILLSISMVHYTNILTQYFRAFKKELVHTEIFLLSIIFIFTTYYFKNFLSFELFNLLFLFFTVTLVVISYIKQSKIKNLF